jgi:hypothetical protein
MVYWMGTIYAVAFCYLLSGAGSWTCTVVEPIDFSVTATPGLASCREQLAKFPAPWESGGAKFRYECESMSVPAWRSMH